MIPLTHRTWHENCNFMQIIAYCDAKQLRYVRNQSQSQSLPARSEPLEGASKRKKCRMLPHQLVYNVKTQNRVSTAFKDHTQQPPQSKCNRLPKCEQAVLFSVVVWCFIPESCGSNVPRAKLQHKKQTSILPRCMWQTKIFNIQRSPTARLPSCSTHARSRARVMPN